MSDGADSVSVLRWGLRRYLLVVVLFVALGALGPTLLGSGTDSYESRAQVGPDARLLLPNLDPLPRIGQSVFANGAVADAVRRSVEPQLPRTADVVPEVVELIAAQDNVVFTVVGHSNTPETAQHVANVAARAFALELNKYADSVGSFRVQRLAAPAPGPVPDADGVLLTVVGVATGLVLGVGVVVLLLVLRQPVIDLPTAERLSRGRGFGQVRVLPLRGGTRGLPRLCRAVLADGVDMVLMTGPRNARHDRAHLVGRLTAMLAESRAVVVPRAIEGVNRVLAGHDLYPGPSPLTVVLEPSEVELATRPDSSTVMLVVREGISSSSLLKHVEQHGPGVGIVLVKRPVGLHARRPSSGQGQFQEPGDLVADPISPARRSRV